MDYPMTGGEWESLCSFVRDEMSAYVSTVVTPLSASQDFQRGQALGTGNYVSLRGRPYLLTNEHVVREALGFHIAHLPGPTDDYILCNRPFLAERWPIDVALTRVGFVHQRSVVPAAHLDCTYTPVTHELLFWLGFPGSKATRHEAVTELNTRYTWFGGPLEIPGIRVLSQQVPFPTPGLREYDADKHVVVHYPARASRNAGEPPVDVPNAKGMSGSFLWDTKFVACTSAGEQWSADKARVVA